MVVKKYKTQRDKRRTRIRAKVKGTKNRPRLSVFRSNKHIFAQLIDDVKGETLVAASDTESVKSAKNQRKSGLSKVEVASKVGQALAKKALKLGIKQVVFDRGGYKYHGRVKSLAEAAREGGLKF